VDEEGAGAATWKEERLSSGDNQIFSMVFSFG